jgi:hypothetical protein
MRGYRCGNLAVMTRAWRAHHPALANPVNVPNRYVSQKNETHDHTNHGCVDSPYRSIDRRLRRPISAQPVGLHQSFVSQRAAGHCAISEGNTEGITRTKFGAGRSPR